MIITPGQTPTVLSPATQGGVFAPQGTQPPGVIVPLLPIHHSLSPTRPNHAFEIDLAFLSFECSMRYTREGW
jgi:hypothetical protein